MTRFSAGEAEIEGILRFLMRRAPGGLRMTPLAGRSRDDLRWRRTARPLVVRLARQNVGAAWGLRAGSAADVPLCITRNGSRALLVDPEASRLIVLLLGPAEGAERRRDGLLEVRDWWGDGYPETDGAIARDLVERCARRIWRRGCLKNGRWHLPGGYASAHEDDAHR